MSSITIELAPETEQALRDRAVRCGQSLEAYLQYLADSAAGNGAHAPEVGPAVPAVVPTFLSRPHLTDAEFERNLRELAAGDPLPPLPADFSRADLYDDHD